MLISDWSSDVCSSDLNFLSLCLSPAHDFGIVRAPSDRAPKRRPHPVSIRSRPRSHFSPFRLEVRGFAVYHYDEIDQTLVTERAAQFREQVARYHAGKLSEDEFRALRLRNGLYMQRFAPMLRINALGRASGRERWCHYG